MTDTMDAGLRALLDELEEQGRVNDARTQERGDKMLNPEPGTAGLMSLLIRSGKRTRLLEIGTSNGYSTIWLAWAARAAGGRVTSIERDPRKQSKADENLRRAGLRDVVDLALGDATEVVASLPGSFDFVFFDADRASAPAQLSLLISMLISKLTPDAMLLADNVLSHPAEISEYLATVESLPGFDHLVVPIGKGLSAAYKDAGVSDAPG